MATWHQLLDAIPHQARTLVRVAGEDTLRFLQGLLSADVGDLTPGQLTAATLLTVKGKIISEVWLLAATAEEPWLALPQAIAAEVVQHLDDHVIMDDVEFEILDGRACAIAWGDDLPAPSPTTDVDAVGVYACDHPLAGRVFVGPRDVVERALASVGQPAEPPRFTAARIAQGRPAWGHELRADRFPPEVGFVDAVSYDKGCFMGQEPLSRIHNRGQVNRVMVRVRLAAALEPGEPVELFSGDKPVGELTSWTAALDGLAIVRRSVAEPGTTLRAGELAVEVVSPPVGDDPGGPGRQATATVALGRR